MPDPVDPHEALARLVAARFVRSAGLPYGERPPAWAERIRLSDRERLGLAKLRLLVMSWSTSPAGRDADE